ncbi:hypothetical protein [Pedobacter deserti]|uniref:hypothetical protein n=1 Tax=Pedobacter deserti TaxID=2817382 RepID=UPI00210D523E|nr:hypothetical protein [Pedobacter sp. SYSU D00382]
MKNTRGNLQNQDDVNPTTQLDKILVEGSDEAVDTNGTGSNRPVPTSDSVVIKDESSDDDHDKD